MATAVRKRMKGEDRRAQILEVAAQEFSRHGFDQTGMDDIARACGISKPVLYQHFQSKDDLFTAAMADKVGALSRFIRAAKAEPDPVKRLILMADETMVTLFDAPALAFTGELGGDDHPLLLRFRDERLQMEGAIDEAVAEFVSANMDGAEVAAPLLGMMSAMVQGSAQGVRRWYADNEKQMPREELARLARELVPLILDVVRTVIDRQTRPQGGKKPGPR